MVVTKALRLKEARERNKKVRKVAEKSFAKAALKAATHSVPPKQGYEDPCPRSDKGWHEIGSIVGRTDEANIADVTCFHCGKCGSIRIDPTEVLW